MTGTTERGDDECLIVGGIRQANLTHTASSLWGVMKTEASNQRVRTDLLQIARVEPAQPSVSGQCYTAMPNRAWMN